MSGKTHDFSDRDGRYKVRLSKDKKLATLWNDKGFYHFRGGEVIRITLTEERKK